MALLAALTAVGAHLRIPLPYVPITLQAAFACLAGLLLGPWRGGASQLVYVTAGLVGFPVFARGGGLHFAENWLPALAVETMATVGIPTAHHVVARLNPGNARPHRFHYAGAFMAQDHRHFAELLPVHGFQVGVAKTARRQLDPDFVRSGIGDIHFLDRKGLVDSAEYRGLHLHAALSFIASPGRLI